MSDLEKRIEVVEQRLDKLEGLFKEKPEVIKKKMSLKEFMLSIKPADDVQKTHLIGYYFEKYEGFSSFNSKDLIEGFRLSKEKLPLNINDKVNMNISKGFFMPDKDKKNNLKAFTVTNSGVTFIENGFKKE